MATLQQVRDEIARQTSVEQSVRALLGSLAGQINDLKNIGGATPQQLESLLSDIRKNTDDLASAVAENTAAAQPAADPNTPAPIGSGGDANQPAGNTGDGTNSQPQG